MTQLHRLPKTNQSTNAFVAPHDALATNMIPSGIPPALSQSLQLFPVVSPRVLPADRGVVPFAVIIFSVSAVGFSQWRNQYEAGNVSSCFFFGGGAFMSKHVKGGK